MGLSNSPYKENSPFSFIGQYIDTGHHLGKDANGNLLNSEDREYIFDFGTKGATGNKTATYKISYRGKYVTQVNFKSQCVVSGEQQSSDISIDFDASCVGLFYNNTFNSSSAGAYGERWTSSPSGTSVSGYYGSTENETGGGSAYGTVTLTGTKSLTANKAVTVTMTRDGDSYTSPEGVIKVAKITGISSKSIDKNDKSVSVTFTGQNLNCSCVAPKIARSLDGTNWNVLSVSGDVSCGETSCTIKGSSFADSTYNASVARHVKVYIGSGNGTGQSATGTFAAENPTDIILYAENIRVTNENGGALTCNSDKAKISWTGKVDAIYSDNYTKTVQSNISKNDLVSISQICCNTESKTYQASEKHVNWKYTYSGITKSIDVGTAFTQPGDTPIGTQERTVNSTTYRDQACSTTAFSCSGGTLTISATKVENVTYTTNWASGVCNTTSTKDESTSVSKNFGVEGRCKNTSSTNFSFTEFGKTCNVTRQGDSKIFTGGCSYDSASKTSPTLVKCNTTKATVKTSGSGKRSYYWNSDPNHTIDGSEYRSATECPGTTCEVTIDTNICEQDRNTGTISGWCSGAYYSFTQEHDEKLEGDCIYNSIKSYGKTEVGPEEQSNTVTVTGYKNLYWESNHDISAGTSSCTATCAIKFPKNEKNTYPIIRNKSNVTSVSGSTTNKTCHGVDNYSFTQKQDIPTPTTSKTIVGPGSGDSQYVNGCQTNITKKVKCKITNTTTWSSGASTDVSERYQDFDTRSFNTDCSNLDYSIEVPNCGNGKMGFTRNGTSGCSVSYNPKIIISSTNIEKVAISGTVKYPNSNGSSSTYTIGEFNATSTGSGSSSQINNYTISIGEITQNNTCKISGGDTKFDSINVKWTTAQSSVEHTMIFELEKIQESPIIWRKIISSNGTKYTIIGEETLEEQTTNISLKGTEGASCNKCVNINGTSVSWSSNSICNDNSLSYTIYYVTSAKDTSCQAKTVSKSNPTNSAFSSAAGIDCDCNKAKEKAKGSSNCISCLDIKTGSSKVSSIENYCDQPVTYWHCEGGSKSKPTDCDHSGTINPHTKLETTTVQSWTWAGCSKYNGIEK